MRVIHIYYDGEDWIHKWHNHALVLSKPVYSAPKHVYESIPLFTCNYTPKIGDTVFDIGAGNGAEIQVFSKLVGSQGKVYAIEADPSAFRRMDKLIDLLQIKNVQTLNFAISDKDGYLYLTQDGLEGVSNRVVQEKIKNEIRVKSITLDELVKNYSVDKIDFLKMNIEGAEKSALRGFKVMFKVVRNWCISCHDFLEFGNIKTYDFVNSWMRERNIERLGSFKSDKKSFGDYYVYGKNKYDELG
jgi:FkbM family methyltransferase